MASVNIRKVTITISTVDWKPQHKIVVPVKMDSNNKMTSEGYAQCKNAALVAMEDLSKGKKTAYQAGRKAKHDTDEKLNMVVYQWEY